MGSSPEKPANDDAQTEDVWADGPVWDGDDHQAAYQPAPSPEEYPEDPEPLGGSGPLGDPGLTGDSEPLGDPGLTGDPEPLVYSEPPGDSEPPYLAEQAAEEPPLPEEDEEPDTQPTLRGRQAHPTEHRGGDIVRGPWQHHGPAAPLRSAPLPSGREAVARAADLFDDPDDAGDQYGTGEPLSGQPYEPAPAAPTYPAPTYAAPIDPPVEEVFRQPVPPAQPVQDRRPPPEYAPQQPQPQPQVRQPAVHHPPVVEQPAPRVPATTRRPVASGRRLAPLVVSLAAKAGVGKSTLAISLAQRAATRGGLGRVVVVDANRGQGDVRKYLRVGQARLPSVYDSAMSGDPRTAIITPARLNAERDPSLPEVGIAVALAPPRNQADPEVVSAEVYRSVIDAARSAADLVVVDTQIVEAHDTSGIIDGVVIPLLSTPNAWGLGVADDSRPGLDNLLGWISANAARFDGARWMVALNRVSDDSPMSVELAERIVSRYGTLVGLAHEDAEVKAAAAMSVVPSSTEVTEMLDAVLWRVIGGEAFDPARAAPQVAERRSIFRRRRS